jgi:predicted nucleic acid-binding protein
VSVFVDTSGLLAVMTDTDVHHEAASRRWRELVGSGEVLVATNYVMVELYAVLQRRFGMGLAQRAADALEPNLSIQWVSQEVHEAALSAFLLANRRTLSLVDCVSFLTMRQLAISRAFACDSHFAEQGFEVEPGGCDTG